MVRDRSRLIHLCRQVKFIIDPSTPLLNLTYSIERLRVWNRTKLSRYINTFALFYNWLSTRRRFYLKFKMNYYFLIQSSINFFIINTSINSFLLTKLPIIFIHLQSSLFRFYLIPYKTFALFAFILYKPLKPLKGLLLLWHRLFNFKFINHLKLNFFNLVPLYLISLNNANIRLTNQTNFNVNIFKSYGFLPLVKESRSVINPNTYLAIKNYIVLIIIKLLQIYLIELYKITLLLTLSNINY